MRTKVLFSMLALTSATSTLPTIVKAAEVGERERGIALLERAENAVANTNLELLKRVKNTAGPEVLATFAVLEEAKIAAEGAQAIASQNPHVEEVKYEDIKRACRAEQSLGLAIGEPVGEAGVASPQIIELAEGVRREAHSLKAGFEEAQQQNDQQQQGQQLEQRIGRYKAQDLVRGLEYVSIFGLEKRVVTAAKAGSAEVEEVFDIVEAVRGVFDSRKEEIEEDPQIVVSEAELAELEAATVLAEELKAAVAAQPAEVVASLRIAELAESAIVAARPIYDAYEQRHREEFAEIGEEIEARAAAEAALLLAAARAVGSQEAEALALAAARAAADRK